jgi:hypothetical protein
MTVYRERLWPSFWMYLAVALVIPASILVFAPVNLTAGFVVAPLLFLGMMGLLVALAPVIEVTDDTLRAGNARVPLTVLGEAASFTAGAATLERGRRLDARAWLCLRGWIDPVVKVPLRDPEDPTPYWLLSTRHPEKLKAALAGTVRS